MNYFRPDISMLREVPKATSEKLLSLETESTELSITEQDAAPSVAFVNQVLHMIQFARQNDEGTHQAAA